MSVHQRAPKLDSSFIGIATDAAHWADDCHPTTFSSYSSLLVSPVF